MQAETLRRAAAKVVASLTARMGAEHLELVEDATHDALLTALQQDTMGGDVTSWLYRVARNRAIDLLRRDGRFERLESDAILREEPALSEPHERDAELHLLLMCCHPSLSPVARVALALTVGAGFTAKQIAQAFLKSESAVRQVLVRAKRQLRDEHVDLALGGPADVEARLESALATIYLIFNEGYFSAEGEQLVRPELCHEAVRMCGVLLDSPVTARPPVYALGALLFFQMARLTSRTDANGDPILLAHQDRTTWDRRQIAVAFDLLSSAASGDVVTSYHLEAEIASYHARAERDADTDWVAIVDAYDALAALNPSPVVALNRVVAISERDGATKGLDALEVLKDDPALAHYPLYHATRGTLLSRAGREADSRRAFERALALASSGPLQRFMATRLG